MSHLPSGKFGSSVKCLREFSVFPVKLQAWLERESSTGGLRGRQEPKQEVCIGTSGSEPHRSQSWLGHSSIPKQWKPESLFLQHAWNTSGFARALLLTWRLQGMTCLFAAQDKEGCVCSQEPCSL